MPGIKTENVTKEDFYNALEKNQRREIEFQTSLCGIQRDDIKIDINGCEAKIFASQGQQRTAALTLKIALSDYMNHIKDEYPVLLLDDIMSELDKSRRMYLSEKIKNKQVLITSADADVPCSSSAKLFYVEDGRMFER